MNSIGAECALIGGLALASHHVVRATQDVELLADADRAAEVDAAVFDLGYRCIHRSSEAANYLRGDERLDFLFASRPTARRLLGAAAEHRTSFGSIRVSSAEGLIAFKLRAFVNDPRRTQDLEDIRARIRPNRDSLDLDQSVDISGCSSMSRCSISCCMSRVAGAPFDAGPAPICASGGDPVPVRTDRDPYQALDELMRVVESLCPVWPPRDQMHCRGAFLL